MDLDLIMAKRALFLGSAALTSKCVHWVASSGPNKTSVAFLTVMSIVTLASLVWLKGLPAMRPVTPDRPPPVRARRRKPARRGAPAGPTQPALEIDDEFTNRGVNLGGKLGFLAEDAIEIVKRCQDLAIPVVGLVAYKYTGVGFKRLPALSIDLTSVPAPVCWVRGINHLGTAGGQNVYFEIQID